MIQRFSHLPRSITRRKFGLMTGAALGAEYLALKKEARASSQSPFTIALVPDPQYLAGTGGSSASTCAGPAAYNGLIQWAITNKNLSVNGVPLNVKAFLQVGDCIDNGSSPGQQSSSVAAYAQADGIGGTATASPKMAVVRCEGNHDYINGGTTMDRTQLADMWRTDKTGAWRPSQIAAAYGSGLDLGNGDVAFWGGTFTDPDYPTLGASINNYMRLWIQGMRIGVLSLETFPRSSVLNWAQGIQAQYPDHIWWVTTHAYMNNSATVAARGATNGSASYSLADAPASNSGAQMWAGSDVSWAGLTAWPNLVAIFGGHFVDGYSGGGGNWVWQRSAATSTSSNGQTVQQVFCDCQGSGGTGDTSNFCSSNPATLDGTSDTMHLMLLRITPGTNAMESFLISTNSGKWTGAIGVTQQTSPVQLFNVTMPTTQFGAFPLPGAIR